MKDLGSFLKRWQNLVGLGIVCLFVVIAVAAPLIAPMYPEWQPGSLFLIPGLKAGLPIPPGDVARLGTIAIGIQGRQIDVYTTLVWGTRSALRFGVVATLFTTLIGLLIGALSAFLGGWINKILMRITDAFLAFPVIAGVILFVQMINLLWYMSYTPAGAGIGDQTLLQIMFESIDPVLLAMVLFSWMPTARMTQGMVMITKDKEFVQAAKALGAGPWRVIFKHLIPNSIAPAIVLATSQVGGMVLLQAALDFIGIDAGSEWGAVLAIGRRWMLGLQGNPLVYWWVFLPITAALVVFGVGWNLVGDAVNDWLNPRIQRNN
jgi:peptide/nickel transport system permease protein